MPSPGFAGFKMGLKFEVPEMSWSGEVRYRHLTGVDFNAKVVKRDKEGKLVKDATVVDGKVVDHYNRQLVNEDGKFVLAEDLKYYTCVDGKEVEISPYGRTKSIEVMGLISKND